MTHDGQLGQASSSSASVRGSTLTDLIRLRAAKASQDAASATESVNDRIARSRQEAQRQRNNQREAEAGPSNVPITAGTASSRAGTAYWTSLDLKAREVEEARQNALLRRRLAGPAPPISWKQKWRSSIASQAAISSASKAANRRASGSEAMDRRRLANETWDFFHPFEVPLMGVPRTPDERPLASLRDSCLASLALSLSTVQDDELRQMVEWTIATLPTHLKERMMNLAARGYSAARLTPRLLRALLAIGVEDEDEDGGEEIQRPQAVLEGSTAEPTSVEDATAEASDQPASVPESWEEELGSMSVHLISTSPSELSLDRLPLVNLSYCQLLSRDLREILLGPERRENVHLRSLSLAGWDMAQLVKNSYRDILSSFPNLEYLSLAGVDFSSLCLSSEALRPDASTFLLITRFFKSLWSNCRKLKVLDLSHCSGLHLCYQAVLDSITASGDGQRLYPQIEQLLLGGIICEDSQVTPVTAKPTQDPRGANSKGWAGPWHAQIWRAKTSALHSGKGNSEIRQSLKEEIDKAAPSMRERVMAHLIDGFRGRYVLAPIERRRGPSLQREWTIGEWPCEVWVSPSETSSLNSHKISS